MAISDLIQALQGLSWPDFLQPHVEVLLLWITWAVDYIDLEYLDYLLWLLLPFVILCVLPILLLVLIYGCVIFLHIYGFRHQIQEAYHTSYWDGARVAIASFWDGFGHVWHGYELHGIEHVPDEGKALFIYYHGCLPLDVYYLISKLVLHKKRSLHCVGDKFIFKIPGWRPLCKMFSITAGTVDECTAELNEGNLLCIAPGGVREALFSDPNVYDILWGKRLGFAKVVIASRTPVIPMFTENCRESFRTPEWGRSFFRWIYEKTKIPLCPIYGGFPVKMITHLGPPITFDYDNVTPEEVRRVIKREVRNLIREHQRLPGSIIRGMLQRFEKKSKTENGSASTRRHDGTQHEQLELLPMNGRHSAGDRESTEIETGPVAGTAQIERVISPEEQIYQTALDDERDELGGI